MGNRDNVDQEINGIEIGLHTANRNYISINNEDLQAKTEIAEQIVDQLISGFKNESPTFAALCKGVTGGGSSYEGLKITKPEEFDIDVLLELPSLVCPVLIENNIPGYVNLKLARFDNLLYYDEDLYNDLSKFVDRDNFILTKEMKNSFMQSIFDRTMSRFFPNNYIRVYNQKYKVSKISNAGPAFKLDIKGRNFQFSIDLVPCIILDEGVWPQGHFRENPYAYEADKDLNRIFLIPKSPKREMDHIERYWRLSFQAQEREIISNKQKLKPTIRILKRIRDKYEMKISSYAIKTLFLWELAFDLPSLDSDEIPELWMNSLSYCVVYMLKRLYQCLNNRNCKIKYFWNDRRDLLDDLSEQQCELYRLQIEYVITSITQNPVPKTIIKFLDFRKYV